MSEPVFQRPTWQSEVTESTEHQRFPRPCSSGFCEGPTALLSRGCGFPNRRRAEPLLRIESECDRSMHSEDMLTRGCKIAHLLGRRFTRKTQLGHCAFDPQPFPESSACFYRGWEVDPIPTSRPKLPTAHQASSETEIRLRLQLLLTRVQQNPALFL